jgi:hypothetical protein
MTVRLKPRAEVLRRSDSSIAGSSSRGSGDDAAAVGMIVQIEREHAHEARERFRPGLVRGIRVLL